MASTVAKPRPSPRDLPDHGGELDVLVVGAGISGIDVAYRVRDRCPGLDLAVVEAKDAIGGTWELFRYPGIRSDSDIFTLAFPFHPWRGADAIVDGPQIRAYLDEVVDAHGLRPLIHLRTRVRAADWSTDDARWRVTLDTPTGPRTLHVRFLVACTGYYDDAHPYDPGFAGAADFAGRLVHPQLWPPDLDCEGRRVVVIGSGATAVTLVPALAAGGADVTMVQRTPSYILARPRGDALADLARRALPPARAHQVIRAKNTVLQWGLYQACRRAPGLMRGVLRRAAIARVGSAEVVDAHFTPPYGPWEQRLCIAPEGDFYAALRDGSARVVTAHIDRLVPEGVRLVDGSVVPADVVVTATGLTIKLFGGVAVSVDGTPYDPAAALVYQGAFLSGLPNAAFVVGYINLSWTVRADLSARLIARVVRRLADGRADWVVPTPPAGVGPTRPLMDLPAGYLTRAADLMPRVTTRYPWALAQNVLRDGWHVNRADLDEGLVWGRVPERARPAARAVGAVTAAGAAGAAR